MIINVEEYNKRLKHFIVKPKNDLCTYNVINRELVQQHINILKSKDI